MNSDPLNRLPIDPEWIAKADAIAESSAKEMGCPVVLIAVQEGGKFGICIGGAPEAGELAELFRDMPRFFVTAAAVCHLSNAIDDQQDRH